MAYKLKLSDKAEKDLTWHAKTGNQPTLKKIYKLFEELAVHPFQGTGKPEALKGNWSGYWSRRINHKDRIIYQVMEAEITVVVVSARGHYGDK